MDVLLGDRKGRVWARGWEYLRTMDALADGGETLSFLFYFIEISVQFIIHICSFLTAFQKTLYAQSATIT